MTVPDLDNLSVHEIVVRSVVAARGIVRTLRDERKQDPSPSSVLDMLICEVGEFQARLDRRAGRSDPKRLNGAHLVVTDRLRYKADVVLDPERPWQEKVPYLGDMIDEVNAILNAAGQCAGQDCRLRTCKWHGGEVGCA